MIQGHACRFMPSTFYFLSKEQSLSVCKEFFTKREQGIVMSDYYIFTVQFSSILHFIIALCLKLLQVPKLNTEVLLATKVKKKNHQVDILITCCCEVSLLGIDTQWIFVQ